MIEIHGVSHAIGGKDILRDVDLVLPAGGVTALIGPNGAGKSTLLSLIGRLQPLQSGQILVGGLPVDRTPGRDLAKILAILKQDVHLGARLRVRELVGLGRYPHSRGRITDDDRQLIGEALRQFDLETVADRFLDTLSGGQRQRAMVAMTLCQGTRYILLDEPLNNLDMFHARGLMHAIRRTADDLGRTFVVVLHDVNHAAVHADRIVAMKDGRIVAHGAPEEVLTPDLLRMLYDYDIHVARVDGTLTVFHHR